MPRSSYAPALFVFVCVFTYSYVVSKPGATAGLIVAYDIFGFQGQSRIRQVCDQLAEAGFFVILPDYYRGQQWTPEKMESQGFAGLMKFIPQFPWKGALETDFAAALALVKKQPTVKKIGTVGFCWGAWIACRGAISGEISAVYNAHPSVHVEQSFGGSETDIAKLVKCPVMQDTAGGDKDTYKEGGDFFKALQAHPFGEHCVTRDFPDMAHGWTTRGDLSDPKIAAGVAKALGGGIEFLKKHLHESATETSSETTAASEESK